MLFLPPGQLVDKVGSCLKVDGGNYAASQYPPQAQAVRHPVCPRLTYEDFVVGQVEGCSHDILHCVDGLAGGGDLHRASLVWQHHTALGLHEEVLLTGQAVPAPQ